MPYIKQELRDVFEPELEKLCRKMGNTILDSDTPSISAMFNYIAFSLLRLLPNSYREMSAGMAGLNDAIEEYRRRFMNPLEDERRRANGDIV